MCRIHILLLVWCALFWDDVVSQIPSVQTTVTIPKVTPPKRVINPHQRPPAKIIPRSHKPHHPPNPNLHTPLNQSVPIKPIPRGAPPLKTKQFSLNNHYASSKNFRALEKPAEKGFVWSEWVDLPNPLMKNWNLLLNNVSYQDGLITIHLPEGSNRTTQGLRGQHGLRIVHTPLDLSSCATVERRSVTYVFPGYTQNTFINNAGHFNINVLNPLFRYLFFVRNRLHNLTDESLIPNNQLPLSDTLILFKHECSLVKPPVFLFDVILRFASSYMQYDEYFGSIPPGTTHCFESIDVPIHDMIDRLNPSKTLKKRSYGRWDTMHFSHKGRWGNTDFYYNFWRNVKRQIWQLYDIDIPVLTGQGLAALVASSQNSTATVDNTYRPKLGIMARYGHGSPRFDGNTHEVENIFKKVFEVSVFDGGLYKWHGDEALRYKLTRSTLLKVQETDVMIGQTGSNNQLSLFMQENKMLVEIKNYMYCANECAKNLANHNRMAFHTLFATDMATLKKNTNMHYTPHMVVKLANEVHTAWTDNVDNFQHESRDDSWASTCDFLWPHIDPAIVSKTKLMTRSNVSRCYLERVPPDQGWYQLGLHKNSLIGRCWPADVPTGTIIIDCMISGLC